MRNKRKLMLWVGLVLVFALGALGGAVVFAATFNPDVDLKTIHEVITELGKSNDSKKDELTDLEAQIDHIKAEKEVIQQQIENQKVQLEQSANMNSDLRNQIKDLENQLLDANNKEDSLLQQMQSLKNELASEKGYREKYDDLAEKINQEAVYAQQVLESAK